MNKVKNTALTVILVVMTATIEAETIDSLALRTVEHRSAVLSLRDNLFNNPAMQSIHFTTSLNTLAATYTYAHASSPIRLEQGNGKNIGAGHIDAYLHKGKSTLWGAASYSNGQVRNTQYCESSDFEILAPYVMADTVGGNLQRERYHFMGGFSYPLGRFNVGAEGEYQALMAYRTRDPRPKNLSGDLKGKVGVSYSLDAKNLLGLAFTARKYKQTNEVEIYNEVSMPVIYHLTGLGTDYYRFRGDQTDTYYKGWAVGGMASFGQRDNQGPFAQVDFNRMKVEKIISSLNQLPMATTVTYDLNATLGYSCRYANHALGASAFAHGMRREGTENIFGSAQDNIYPLIAEAQQYRLVIWNAGLNLVWQQDFGRNGYAVKVLGAYSDHDEHYAEPLRTLSAAALSAGVSLEGHLTVGSLLLMGNLSAAYHWATSSALTLTESTNGGAITAPTLHYFNYLSDNRWQSALHLEAAYDTQRSFMPFVALRWNYAHYAQTNHDQQIEIAAGVRF